MPRVTPSPQSSVAPIALDAPAQQSQAGAVVDLLGFAGNALNVAEDEMQRHDRTVAVEADTALQGELNELLYNPESGFMAKRGADALSAQPDLEAQFEEAVQRRAASMNNRQRSLFEPAANARLLRAKTYTLQHAQIERRSWMIDTSTGRVETAIEDARLNPSLSNIEKNVGLVREEVGVLADLEGWGPEIQESREAELRSTLYRVVMERAVDLNDMEGVQGYRQRFWDDLSTEDQGAFLDYMEGAERSRAAAAARQLREEERAFELIRSDTFKDGVRLHANGDLDVDWIEQNRHRLEDDDYQEFYKLVRGKTTSTNPVVYAELRERQALGEEVQEEAKQELFAGNLSISDWEKLRNPIVEPRDWYQRGTSHIRTALKPSEINYNPAQAQALANALDDWEVWSAENRDAKPGEAREMYRQIVGEYVSGKADEMLFSTPLPRYADSRDNMDIRAVWDRTSEALENGEIDEQEFERQAVLLNRYREIVERREREAASRQSNE